jgi:hypothetical protein
MNQNTASINKWLSDDSIIEKANIHLESNPNHSFLVNGIEVKLSESVETFLYIKNFILQAITKGIYEKLPTIIQVNIFNSIKTAVQNRNNVNQIIVEIQNIYHHFNLSGLEYKVDSFDNFKRSLTEISNLRRSYSNTLKSLENTKRKVNEFNLHYNKSKESLNESINNNNSIIKLLNEVAEKTKLANSDSIKIEKLKQEIENSKQEIVAFKENINSYKDDITEYTDVAQGIIDNYEQQKKRIQELINEAETALSLKSSEGISAAISAQYTSENKKIKKIPWLIASSVFLFFALFGIVLLLFNNIELTEKIKFVSETTNSIIARIVFVGISVTGASFCANQFLKQKNLADEYAFRLVLAKSILAFSKEIEKLSPDDAIEYIKDVLKEINKSPLNKEKEKTEGLTGKDVSILQKIIDTVVKVK